jgi:hypothetical protein
MWRVILFIVVAMTGGKWGWLKLELPLVDLSSTTFCLSMTQQLSRSSDGKGDSLAAGIGLLRSAAVQTRTNAIMMPVLNAS